MEPLSPRLAVPFTDAEVIELYAKARVAKDLAPPPNGLDEELDLYSKVMRIALLALVDALILMPIYVGLRDAVSLYDVAAQGLVGLLSLTVVLIFFAGGRALGAITFGPVGYFVSLIFRPKQEKAPVPDPSDPEVLAQVIDYISEMPTRRSAELRAEILHQRAQIEQTLAELPDLIEAFDRELRITDDSDLRLLMESRRESAGKALERLREVDQNLAEQFDQAEEAVKPLIRIRDQFSRYKRLSQSLSRIQAAHELASEGEERVHENRVELQALYASSMAAQARLAEIQSVMESTERAREEVRQLIA